MLYLLQKHTLHLFFILFFGLAVSGCDLDKHTSHFSQEPTDIAMDTSEQTEEDIIEQPDTDTDTDTDTAVADENNDDEIQTETQTSPLPPESPPNPKPKTKNPPKKTPQTPKPGPKPKPNPAPDPDSDPAPIPDPDPGYDPEPNPGNQEDPDIQPDTNSPYSYCHQKNSPANTTNPYQALDNYLWQDYMPQKDTQAIYYVGPLTAISQDCLISEGCGQKTKPFDSLEYALTQINWGDTLYLLPGEYTENIQISYDQEMPQKCLCSNGEACNQANLCQSGSPKIFKGGFVLAAEVPGTVILNGKCEFKEYEACLEDGNTEYATCEAGYGLSKEKELDPDCSGTICGPDGFYDPKEKINCEHDAYGQIYLTGLSFVTIHNFTFYNGPKNGLAIGAATDKDSNEILYSSNIIVSDLTIDNIFKAGVYIGSGSHNVVVMNSHLSRTQADGTGENLDVDSGLRNAENETHDIAIINNTVTIPYNKEGICVDGKNILIAGNDVSGVESASAIYFNGTNAQIQNNKLHDSGNGIGINNEYCKDMEDINVFNNMIYNNTDRGIWVAAFDCGKCDENDIFLRENMSIFHNTIVKTGTDGSGQGIVISDNDHTNNITVKNNIISKSQGAQIYLEKGLYDCTDTNADSYCSTSELTGLTRVTIDHNIIFCGEEGYECLEYWLEDMIFKFSQNSFYTDPKLKDEGNNNFDLLHTSPAINAATSTLFSKPEFDYRGDCRHEDAGWLGDIGADEYIP